MTAFPHTLEHMYGSFASPDLDDDGLIGVADALNRHIASAQVALLGVIAEVDRRRAWQDSGARDARTGSRSLRLSLGRRTVGSSRRGLPGARHRARWDRVLGIDKWLSWAGVATAENEDERNRWRAMPVRHFVAARPEGGAGRRDH